MANPYHRSFRILNEQKHFYQEFYQSINGTSNNREKISIYLNYQKQVKTVAKVKFLLMGVINY